MNKYRNESYITQRQNKDGSWTFQFYMRLGDRTYTKSFSEKKYGSAKLAFDTAVNFKHKKLEERRTNSISDVCKKTVREIFEEYQETTTDSYTTKKRHGGLFERFVNCKNTPINEITKSDIRADLNAMVEVATDDTIMRVYSIWKNDIIGYSLDSEYIDKNLMFGIKKPVSHVIHVKKKTTTDRETILKVENLLLNHLVNQYNAKLMVYLIEVLYYTGMRPAEAIALTRDDIKNGYISVTKELGSNMHEDNVIRRCKTPNSIRDIPISPMLKPILDELMAFSKYDELFKGSNGEYMNSTYIGNAIRNVIKREDGLEFNLYRLRHNLATELISKNVDSRTTMDLLGHSSYAMSMYYANSSEKQKEDAILLIN